MPITDKPQKPSTTPAAKSKPGSASTCPLAKGFPAKIGGMDVVPQADGSVKVGKSLVIKGDEKYQKKVLKDLQGIEKTPTGSGLLKSLDGSGKKVTINPKTGGNDASFYTTGQQKADGTPGPGSDTEVGYNPDRKKIGKEKWETRPPAIGLAHELVHAEQAATGNVKKGTTNNDSRPDPADPKKTHQEKVMEVEAAGIDPNDKYPYNENKIRSEWKPKQPERKWY